ncbi:MAG: hypothetical protein LBL81_02000 [Tannerella sp.]|jgi:hypothetical protein|nr:hypothetical protein [Tannerella sp.]
MTKKRKVERRFSFGYILGGGILKEDFIVKHTRMILLVALLMLLFIGNRYSCLLKMRQIDRMEKELQDTRLEAMTLSNDLARYSRLSQIEGLLQKQGSDLQAPATPPYVLNK